MFEILFQNDNFLTFKKRISPIMLLKHFNFTASNVNMQISKFNPIKRYEYKSLSDFNSL